MGDEIESVRLLHVVRKRRKRGKGKKKVPSSKDVVNKRCFTHQKTAHKKKGVEGSDRKRIEKT